MRFIDAKRARYGDFNEKSESNRKVSGHHPERN
jgi:hypothetical protein